MCEDRKSRADVVFYAGLFENVLRDAYASFPEIPSRESERDLKYVRHRVEREGFPFLSVQLPLLGKALETGLETGQLIVPRPFARKRKAGKTMNIPRLFSALFLTVFTPEGALIHDGHGAVGEIRQLAYLCYKVQVPFSREAIETACQKFRDTDNSLKPLTKDELDGDALKYARFLLRRLFRGFDPGKIIPHHGPGAVAERLHGREKYDFNVYSPAIAALYSYPSLISYGYFAQTVDALVGPVTSWPREFKPSRVCMVPKDSRGPRVIAAEPALLQFLQQGLGGAIIDWVEKHPLTRGHVLFTNQNRHRALAKLASRSRRYATLDLKDASDRVSLDLVEQLFPESLLPYLKALRSPSAYLPDGSTVVLKKYASMGSALCFPIEALTFWALARGAMWTTCRQQWKRRQVYVYGDDIIVPTDHARTVIGTLGAYNVRFNETKCFIEGDFRESCGMDAYQGNDVTPVRVKALVDAVPRHRRASLLSLNANANAFFDHGYWRAARFLDEYVEKWWGPIPTTLRTFAGLSRRSSVLPMITWFPDGTIYRWDKALQRREVRTLKLKARAQRSLFPDWTSRLGHNLTLGVSRPYSDEVAVPHSAQTKAVWESIA